MIEAESKAGPLARTVRKALPILVLIYIAQIWVQTPSDRPVAACWPPYLVTHFFMVTIPKYVVPKEHEFRIEQAYRVMTWNKACVQTLSGWEWMTEQPAPTKENKTINKLLNKENRTNQTPAASAKQADTSERPD